MVKHLSDCSKVRPPDEITALKTDPGIIAIQIEYDVRRMQENEASEVSRCTYKTYGNTSFDDDNSYPERLIEKDKALYMITIVAVTREDVFKEQAIINSGFIRGLFGVYSGFIRGLFGQMRIKPE
jgi:hypothetical protein